MSLSQVQKLATQTLFAVENGNNLSDYLAQLMLQNPDLSAQDKGMLHDIAFGYQRFSGSLKFMLHKMLNKPIKNKELEYFLLVALYQLNHTRNAPHAVVNECVQHIGQIGRGQYRAFANAILRRFLREREHLNKACQHNDIAKYNLPIWLQKTLQKQYPKHWHNIATAFLTHPPLTLRVNRRHLNAQQYLEILNKNGLDGTLLDDYAIKLNTPTSVAQLPHFQDGWVSVQDFGAQQAAPLLQPKNGERILDACAAPGGKTGHLLELADCEVIALDIDEKRLSRVAENLTRLNVQAALHAAPAQDLEKWWDGTLFDAILADVPCTASGTIKRNPDIKWLRRVGDAQKTAQQQEILLDNLWTTLKPQGRFLLATCSLFAEENSIQCQKFLARHRDAKLIEEKMILPSEKQDGFYYALMVKKT